MKLSLKLATIALLVAMVFLPTQSAAASTGGFDGEIIVGDSYTLASGETLTGDLMVFGGSALIEEGATVEGQVVVIGGSLEIYGEVTSDVAVTGGTVTLGATAHIYGNLATVGATLDRAEGSQIDGGIYNTATSWADGINIDQPVIPDVPDVPTVPSVPVTPTWPNFNFGGMLGSVYDAIAQAVGLALLAMLLMLFLAPHADRIAHAVIAQPITAGGIGLLTVVVFLVSLIALGVVSLMIVTLILTIPLMIILSVALIAAGTFGWIAIGYEVGQRFTQAIHQTWHPAFSAGLGTFALSLASSALTGIPVLNCLGWLVPFLLGLAALGAVVLTRFGTQTVNAPIKQTAVAPVTPNDLPPA